MKNSLIVIWFGAVAVLASFVIGEYKTAQQRKMWEERRIQNRLKPVLDSIFPEVGNTPVILYEGVRYTVNHLK